jgi:hypothetical protein
LTHRDFALQATQGVSERFDAIINLFESFAYFLNKLSMRSNVPFEKCSKIVVIEILVDLLKTLAHATQMMKQDRLGGYFVHGLRHFPTVICRALREGVDRRQ